MPLHIPVIPGVHWVENAWEMGWAFIPVLHLLVSVAGRWQVLVEAVVRRVPWGVVDDGGVPVTTKTRTTFSQALILKCEIIRSFYTFVNMSSTSAIWFRSSPLCCGGGGSVHGELPHGTLLQVLLLPARDVSLQGQDPLLALPQLLLQ